MEIEIVYPTPKKSKRFMDKLRRVYLIVSLFAVYACPIINISYGGKPWSIVVLWSMWYVWSTFLTSPLIENNLVSRTARTLYNTVVLLVLIEVCLYSGWAGFVVPIVCFGSLIIVSVFFFVDVSKQRQNMMPMLWMISGSLLAMVITAIGWHTMNWPTIVLGSTAMAVLLAVVIILRHQFFLELKKRFHIK